jgi:hypothetical protein
MILVLVYLGALGVFGHSNILLSSVQALTLKSGHQTAARRGPPVPQLQCVGGNCDDGAQYVRVMQCSNKGLDSHGMPQWECKSELPVGWHLGVTDVSCEGYRDSDDPYILAGSCGVEYHVHGPPKPTVPPHSIPFNPVGPVGPQGIQGPVGVSAWRIYQPQEPIQQTPHTEQHRQSSTTGEILTIALGANVIICAFLLCCLCCCCICCSESKTPVHVVEPGYRSTHTVVQPVLATSSASDFATGYVLGNAAASHQPHYSPQYSAPPPPPRREPSPPRREPSPPPRETSTGYGTTKRR